MWPVRALGEPRGAVRPVAREPPWARLAADPIAAANTAISNGPALHVGDELQGFVHLGYLALRVWASLFKLVTEVLRMLLVSLEYSVTHHQVFLDQRFATPP